MKADLEAVESQQADAGRGIEEWKAAVERVERGLREGEEVMGGNRQLVEGLVAGLEARLKLLEKRACGD